MYFLVKRPLLRSLTALGSGVTCVALLTGCNGFSSPTFITPQILDTADYTIDYVRIFAPPAGELGNGRVEVIVEFTLNGNTGNVSPIVWVWEHDFGNNFPPQPGSSGDLGSENPHEGTTSLIASGRRFLQRSFTFTCGGPNGDEVIGPNGGGTGEGDWDSFPPQVKWDDAEIVAAAARQNPSGTGIVQSKSEWRWSRQIDMSCAEDPADSGQYHIQHSPINP